MLSLKLGGGFEIGKWIWNWRVKLGIEGENLKLNWSLEIKLGLKISGVVIVGLGFHHYREYASGIKSVPLGGISHSLMQVSPSHEELSDLWISKGKLWHGDHVL
jgi:hypothetical protein